MIYKHINHAEQFPDSRIEAYIHDPHEELNIGKRKAIVVCPGGGYGFLSEREAEPVALQYFAAGLNVFILRYSILEKAANNYAPLIEACLAIKYIREHCDELYVDPEHVSIIGFSAGGHLAAWTGTSWHVPQVAAHLGGADPIICKPTSTILSYAVLTSDPKYRHTGSIWVLNGMPVESDVFPKDENGMVLDEEGMSRFSVDKLIDERTAPAFLWHTFEDDCVNVQNSLLYASRMKEFNIPFEMHIYTNGSHGLSLCNAETASQNDYFIKPYAAQWLPLSIHWLLECPFKK
jgi:acetyl esterase/lipase